jgi:hypothetical protein
METSIAEVESPQTTEEQFSIENASTDDIRNALGVTPETHDHQPETVAEEQIPENEGQEPQAESQEPEAAAPETEAEDTEGGDEEEKLGKRRIRPRNELDQQVIDLYRSEGFSGSFADASRIIYGQNAEPAPQSISPNQEQVEATEPDPISGIDKEADDIRASILELEGKVEKAAEDLETTEALRLQREIMKQELQLQNLTLRKQQVEQEREQQVYQSHRTRAMESRDRVYERFPQLQDKQSVYRKQFDDFVSQAQSDPDYAAVFESPRWPELIASEFASINPMQQAPQAQPEPAPQVPQQTAPQMGTQAKVLTTGTTAQPVNTPATREGLLQQLPNMNTKDIYSLLGSPGGAQPLR